MFRLPRKPTCASRQSAPSAVVDFGRMLREDLKPKRAIERADLMERPEQAGAARTAEAKSGNAQISVLLPQKPEEVPGGVPNLIRDGSEYYMTDRSRHPRSNGSWVGRSVDLMANFGAFAYNDLISLRPLLMTIGTDADTAYFSRDTIAQAKEPKELFETEGKTHVGLYDDLSKSMPKLVDFYSKSLAA